MSPFRRALLATCALLALSLALCFAPSHATLLATPLERASPLSIASATDADAGDGFVFAQLVDSDLSGSGGSETALALAETDAQTEAEGFFDDLVQGIKKELNSNPAARQAVQSAASSAVQAVQAVASKKVGELTASGVASAQQKWSGSTLGQIGVDVLNTAANDLNSKILPAVFNRVQTGVSNSIDKFAGVTPTAAAPAQTVKDAVRETARDSAQTAANDAVKAVQTAATKVVSDVTASTVAKAETKLSDSTVGQIGLDAIKAAADGVNNKILPAAIDQLQQRINNAVAQIGGGTPATPATPATTVADAAKSTANDAAKAAEAAAAKVVSDMLSDTLSKAQQALPNIPFLSDIAVSSPPGGATISFGSMAGSSPLVGSTLNVGAAAPAATSTSTAAPVFSMTPVVAPWSTSSQSSSMDAAISSIFAADAQPQSMFPSTQLPSSPSLISPRRFTSPLTEEEKASIRLRAIQAAVLGSSAPLPTPRLHIHSGFKLPGRAPTASEMGMEAERARQLRVAHRLHQKLYMMHAQLQEQRQTRLKAERKQARKQQKRQRKARQQRRQRKAARRAGQSVAATGRLAGQKLQRAAAQQTNKAKRTIEGKNANKAKRAKKAKKAKKAKRGKKNSKKQE